MSQIANHASNIDHLFGVEELHPTSVAEVIAQESFADKLKQCPVLFGKPFQQLDMETQRAIVLRRLQQIFNTLKLNPLWENTLRRFGELATPQNFDDWQALPMTDRDMLHDYYMGERKGVVVPLTRGGFEIVASGGTSSGLPTETVYSQRELHDTYAIAGQFMGNFVLPDFLSGNDDPRWIITTLTDSEMWSSGTMLGGVLQRTPGVNFVAAGPMSENVYHHIMSFAGPKAILGMSREIEGLIPLGKNLPLKDRESFRLAIYGSGIIQSKKIEDLKALYPNIQILSYFASNQAEAIGVQLKPGAFLTSVPGLHFIEIVDAKGRWVEVGEEGELLVTRLHATEAPIIRMQLGDRMIRRPDYSSESLVAEQFEFAGRSSDILHIGESHYPAGPVYRALCATLKQAGCIDIDNLSHEIQFQNNRNEKILYLLVATDSPHEHAELLKRDFSAECLRSHFVQALKSGLPFFDRTEKHRQALDATVYRFGIKIVAPGSPEFFRTRVGKVPLIRDVL